MKFSLSSLRSRAIVLVLLAILPLLALIIYMYLYQRNRAIGEVQRSELVAARNLATIQETLISTTRQLLTTLAAMPEVQRRGRVWAESKVGEGATFYFSLQKNDDGVAAGTPSVSPL